MATLTQRERQIIGLLRQGMDPKEIAKQLGTRPATVRVQLFEARKKAGCRTTIELAVKVATANE